MEATDGAHNFYLLHHYIYQLAVCLFLGYDVTRTEKEQTKTKNS